MTNSPSDLFKDVLERARSLKQQADDAMAQISDEAFFSAPDANANSIAIIVKHLSGNLRSRWRDFLTTDGEKPDRNRDAEFEITTEDSRPQLMLSWRESFDILFRSLEELTARDLTRIIIIRGQQQSVLQATTRQLAHTAYHVGQIVYLAKLYAGSQWKTLSIAKGGSAEFNRKMSRS